MISDKPLATRISSLMLEASGALNEAAKLISESRCPQESKKSLFLAIGSAMGHIGIDVLNPLFREHPELKPSDYMLPEDFKDSDED